MPVEPPVERAENNLTTTSSSRLAIGHPSKDCPPPGNRLGGPCAPTVPSAPPVTLDPTSESTGKGESFPVKLGDIGLIGRTRQPVAVSSWAYHWHRRGERKPQGIVSCSSTSRCSSPLSLPFFHLRSDLLRLVSGNGTSESQRLKSDRVVQLNRHEKARSAAPSLKTPTRCIKTPPPFSHKSRDFRVAFLYLGFISRAPCQCAIARACIATVPSFVNQRKNQKRPHHPPCSK